MTPSSAPGSSTPRRCSSTSTACSRRPPRSTCAPGPSCSRAVLATARRAAAVHGRGLLPVRRRQPTLRRRAGCCARGIDLPGGDPSDRGRRGDGVRHRQPQERRLRGDRSSAEGIAPYPGSWRCSTGSARRHPGRRGLQLEERRPVLAAAHSLDRFPVVVDGVVAADEGLAGKPAPDMFLDGRERLGVDARARGRRGGRRSGVAAGAAGGFGLVVGVDRGVGRRGARDAGADLVVTTSRSC